MIHAFMHSPELLILDEPTSGLDPLLQREFLDLVEEARDAGATVFMSSHVLSEVEQVAGRVAIIRGGVLVDLDVRGHQLIAVPDGLRLDVELRGARALRGPHQHDSRHHAGQEIELTFAGPVDVSSFEMLDNVDQVRMDGDTLRCLLRGEPDELLKTASRYRVTAWSAQDRELEDLFLDHYRMPVEEPMEVSA